MGHWILGYNTNGLAHHRLDEAIVLLAELDYQAVALTLDVHHLDPFAADHEVQVREVADLLAERRLQVVIESGARFNLDFRIKHYPSLLCRRDRGRRVDFLRRCVDVAVALGAPVVSFWSGHDFEELEPAEAFDLLVDGVGHVLEHAEGAGVDLAFEPEPGMFVETLEGYAKLKAVFSTSRLGLALDVGHLMVTGECGIPDAIRRFRGELLTVTVEDMKRGVHEHLPFGEGDIDFPPVFQALEDIGYRGPVIVELSRGSPDGPRVAADAMRFLSRF